MAFDGLGISGPIILLANDFLIEALFDISAIRSCRGITD